MKSFSIYDTTISFSQDEQNNGICNENYDHYKLFTETMSFLSSLNFYVGKDKNIEKNYAILSKDHRQGRSGDLEFKAKRYPRGFKIMFYQNVVFENPNGGEYDFDKREKMPYLLGKQCDTMLYKLANFLLEKGITDETKISYRTAEDKIKASYVESFHHPQTNMDFTLSDLNGGSATFYSNSIDRDNKRLYNGDVKYFRDYNGYLYRGKCYHNINNMWWVITNKNTVRNIASFELFDLSPEDVRGRQKPHKPPKEFLEKRKALKELSTKELLNELKRRRSCDL